MDRDVFLAIVAIAPQLIALALITAVGVRYREPIARALRDRVTSVSAFGFKIELSAASIDEAVKERARSAGARTASQGRLVSSEEIVDRAQRLAEQIAGRTILWVDDKPMGNRLERRLLRQMGVFAETVVNNAEAKVVLDDPAESIGLIISDILRADGQRLGLELVADVAERPGHPEVILYITNRDPDLPIPQGAFGIADRPDELLNLVMDALDRLSAPSGRPADGRPTGNH